MLNNTVVGSATFEVTANTGPLRQQVLEAQAITNQAVTGMKNLFASLEQSVSLSGAITAINKYCDELTQLKQKAIEAHVAIYDLRAQFSGGKSLGTSPEMRAIRQNIDQIREMQVEIAKLQETMYTRYSAFTGKIAGVPTDAKSYLPVGKGGYYPHLEYAESIRNEMLEEQEIVASTWGKMAGTVKLNVDRISTAYAEYDAILARENQLRKAYAEQASFIEAEKALAIEASLKKEVAARQYLAKELQAQHALSMYGPKAGAQEAWTSAYTGAKQIGNVTNEMGNIIESTSNLEKALGRISRTLIAFMAVSAALEIKKWLKFPVEEAIKFNEVIESARVGIAALIEAQANLSRGGKPLSSIDELNASMQLSDEIIRKLQYDNLQTVATFEQLTKAFHSATAPGFAAGFNIEQIRAFTLSMVQAASAMQMPLDMMAEEMRSMLRGTITPRATIIATNLGITNEQIRQHQGNALGLFNFVMGKLEAFRKYGSVLQDTFSGAWSNLKDVFSVAAGEAGKPFFESMKAFIKELIDQIAIIDDKSRRITIRPEFIDKLKELFTFADMIVKSSVQIINLLSTMVSIIAYPINRLYEAFQFLNDYFKSHPERTQGFIDELSKRGVEIPRQEMPVDTEGITKQKIMHENYLQELKFYYDRRNRLIEESERALKDKIEPTYLVPQEEEAWSTSGKSKYIQEQADALANIDRIIKIVSKSFNDLIDAQMKGASGISKGFMDAGIQLDNLNVAAKNASVSFNDLVNIAKELSNIDYSKIVSSMEENIAKLRDKIDLIKKGVPSWAMSAEELYRQRVRDLSETAEVMMRSGASQETIDRALQVIAYRKSQAEVERTTALELARITEEMKERRQAAPSRAAPLTRGRIAEDLREIERIKDEHYQRMKELDSNYAISALELEGRTYEASIEKINQWADEQIFKYDQTIKNVQAKIDELSARVAERRGGAEPEVIRELERQRSIVQFLNDERDDYIEKVNRQRNVEIALATTTMDNWIKMAELYRDSATSLEEIAYWELYILGLGKTKELLAYPDFMKDPIEKKKQREEYIQYVKTKGTFGEGLQVGMMEFTKDFPTIGKLGIDTFQSLMESINRAGDVLADFCTTGKANFSDFVTSLINDIVRLMARFLLINFIDNILKALNLPGLSDMGKILSAQKHTGDSSGVYRLVPAEAFMFAPRLHQGLNYDEYPAILQKGETVIPKNADRSIKLPIISNNAATNINTEIQVNINGNVGTQSGVGDHRQLGTEIARIVSAEFDKKIAQHLRPGGLIHKGGMV